MNSSFFRTILFLIGAMGLLGGFSFGQYSQTTPSNAIVVGSYSECPDPYIGLGESCYYRWDDGTSFGPCRSICVDHNSLCIEGDTKSYTHSVVCNRFGSDATYLCEEGGNTIYGPRQPSIYNCAENDLLDVAGGCLIPEEPVCDIMQAGPTYHNEQKAFCNYSFASQGTDCRNGFGDGQCNAEGTCVVPFNGCQSDLDCDSVQCHTATCDTSFPFEGGSTPNGFPGSGLGGQGTCVYTEVEGCLATGCTGFDQLDCGPCEEGICNPETGIAECQPKQSVGCPSCSFEVCDEDTGEYVCQTNDEDGDGINSCNDCDDENPDVYPGAAEICDGLDNDCDAGTQDGIDENGYGDACTGDGEECQANLCTDDGNGGFAMSCEYVKESCTYEIKLLDPNTGSESSFTSFFYLEGLSYTYLFEYREIVTENCTDGSSTVLSDNILLKAPVSGVTVSVSLAELFYDNGVLFESANMISNGSSIVVDFSSVNSGTYSTISDYMSAIANYLNSLNLGASFAGGINSVEMVISSGNTGGFSDTTVFQTTSGDTLNSRISQVSSVSLLKEIFNLGAYCSSGDEIVFSYEFDFPSLLGSNSPIVSFTYNDYIIDSSVSATLTIPRPEHNPILICEGDEVTPESCDDGLFCNGVEGCSIENGCEAGEAVVCPEHPEYPLCYTGVCDINAEDECVYELNAGADDPDIGPVLGCGESAIYNTVTCTYDITFSSLPEECNGEDDDCDGLIDEGSVCGTCGTSHEFQLYTTDPSIDGADFCPDPGTETNIQLNGFTYTRDCPSGSCFLINNHCGDLVRDDPATVAGSVEECDGVDNCTAACECEAGYLADQGECFEIVDCEGDVEYGSVGGFDLGFTCNIPDGATPAPGQEYQFDVVYADGSTDSFVQAGDVITNATLGINDLTTDLTSLECSLTLSETGATCSAILTQETNDCGFLSGEEYLVFNLADLDIQGNACIIGTYNTGPTFDLTGSPWTVNWTCDNPIGVDPSCSLNIVVPNGPVCQGP